MSTFTAFPRLPPELRSMIWKAALANEAHDRMALVHRESLRIIPSKSMISPLLKVNRESREEALAHYTYRLDILNVPAPEVEMMTYDEYFEKVRRYTKTQYWVFYASNETYDSVKRLLNSQLDHIQPSKAGCVYLSLKTDKFLLSFTAPQDCSNWYGTDCCIAMFSFEKQAEVMGSASIAKYQVQQRHVSVRLSPGACSLVANVVHCPDEWKGPHPKPWPGKIWHPSNTAMDIWMAHYFHHMRSPATSGGHQSLDQYIKSDRYFEESANMILEEGAKSLVTSVWQREDYHRDPNGWRVLTRFVAKKK